MQSTKGDIRVVFDKLMCGEKLFAKQISRRFNSKWDPDELLISCMISTGGFFCVCEKVVGLLSNACFPQRRCKAGRQTYCGFDVC